MVQATTTLVLGGGVGGLAPLERHGIDVRMGTVEGIGATNRTARR